MSCHSSGTPRYSALQPETPVRNPQRGIYEYRTVAEGEAERERYALAQLRAPGK
jgi:hypothetical protein